MRLRLVKNVDWGLVASAYACEYVSYLHFNLGVFYENLDITEGGADGGTSAPDEPLGLVSRHQGSFAHA